MNKSEQNVFCESEGMIAWEKERDGRKTKAKRKKESRSEEGERKNQIVENKRL